MAIKLNLVKARVISSKEDLMTFKKEATAALLKFAESNDCDLDIISATLTKKYAEIAQALNEGHAVESEVEIYPQTPMPPKQACMQKLAAPVAPGVVDEENPAILAEEPTDPAALAQVPAATDPLELMMAQEGANEQMEEITMEDIAALLASNPEGQAVAGEVMAAAPKLGSAMTWALMARIAKRLYTAAETKALRAAIKVVAADDDGEDAEPEAEAAGEDAPHKPKKDQSTAVAEKVSEDVFTNPGDLKAASDLVAQFNEIMDGIDPDLLPPVAVEEVSRAKSAEQGRERTMEPTEELAGLGQAEGKDLVTPAFNALDEVERSEILQGLEIGEENRAINAWYAGNGMDILDDVLTGIDSLVQAADAPNLTAKEVMDAWQGSTKDADAIPTTGQIKTIINEMRHGQAQVTEEGAEITMTDDHGQPITGLEFQQTPKQQAESQELMKRRKEQQEKGTNDMSDFMSDLAISDESRAVLNERPDTKKVEHSEMVEIPTPFTVVEVSPTQFHVRNELTGKVEYQSADRARAEARAADESSKTMSVPKSVYDEAGGDPKKIFRALSEGKIHTDLLEQGAEPRQLSEASRKFNWSFLVK